MKYVFTASIMGHVTVIDDEGNRHQIGEWSTWIVEADTWQDALDTVEEYIVQMIPESAGIWEVSDANMYAPGIPMIDIQAWLNDLGGPDSNRYHGIAGDSATALMRHVHDTQEMVGDDHMFSHILYDYGRYVTIPCKVSAYASDGDMRGHIIECIAELNSDLMPEKLESADREKICDAIVAYWEEGDRQFQEYGPIDSAYESGREYAKMIASDLGTENKYYLGRQGGHMQLDLPTDRTEWGMDEIMQYSVMAWEVGLYQQDGFKHDLAWQLVTRFEDTEECSKVLADIIADRAGGGDLTSMIIC